MRRAKGLPDESEESRHPAVTNLTEFKRLVWPHYRHAPHLELIDNALMDVARYVESGGAEGTSRLAIFVPPRHGKSMTVARLFPAWILGRNPDKRFIMTGYGASLAEASSRIVRNIITKTAYAEIFRQTRLARDSQSRSAWNIEGREGGMDAVGIEGAATGKGAHILLIDDPVKSRKEAESRIVRESIWQAYTNDLYTRLEPGGAVVLIMTRWHDDDLAGRLLKQGSDDDDEPWTVVRLPALAEEGDLLGREPGAALWPERYNAGRFAKIRATLGPYAFASLYQQAPRPREGGLFKYEWIDATRVTEVPKRLVKVVVAVDPAATAAGDETGIVVIGLAYHGNERHAYVLRDASLHGTPDQWARRTTGLYHEFKCDYIVVEVNQGGDMVEHTLKTSDVGVRVKKVRAADGKATRAEPVAALYEQGKVHHVSEFPALEDQMTGWVPGSASPDRMDALVWGLTDLLITPRGVGLR